MGKISILLILLACAALIGVREYATACAPPKEGPGDHSQGGHESGAADAQHSGESFGTQVCESGLIAALKDQIGFGTTAAAVKVAPKATAPNEQSGHDHGAAPEKSESEKEHGHGAGGHDEAESEGLVKLTPAQILAAGIEMAPAASGSLIKEISVPGRIAINANAQAKVVPKLPGTVAKVMKQIGERVNAGDVLATIESREMADAKGEFLAATRSEELAKSVFEREERLWKQKVTAEQDYLNAKNAQQEAAIKRDLAHQKLHAIGLSEEEIAAVPIATDESTSRFFDLRAPISGRVTARDLVMGQIVGTDKEVFSIADLSTVWIEMAVPPADLSFAKDGQEVRVQSAAKSATAKVVVISPTIDADTRAAKVIAELANGVGEWQLGDYVNAQLLSGKQDVALLVPRDAIQTIKGAKAVFVSDGEGFRMRPVTTGREDSERVEILSGLEFGETIATSNAFTLKAELGKAEAEHEH